eukprot:TRINITY_DN3124_c3_g1_i1.p1 TRINITY_DN3124_c3_g1~~TRINITY_DN3124_c3_g1_i1.p1  ORF type:complete len:224 (-),score=107.08 TRINITY_DN3124_c3_g1_i1:97-768(-)
MSNSSFTRGDGDVVPGYVTLNRNSGINKGVVVLQEWWGLNEQIIHVAETLSSHGFICVVPDLYRGKVATDHETAGHLMSGLDFPSAVKDIQGAANFLKSLGCAKVGVTGFCMGGALTLLAAINAPEFSAASCFYGIPQAGDASTIKIPVQCHFGDLDSLVGFSDKTAACNLEAKLKSGNVNHEFYHYPNSGHAFMNEKKEDHDPQIAALALNRLVTFFNNNLA